MEEATVRAACVDKDQRKELDAMLSSLGVAPVSGKYAHSGLNFFRLYIYHTNQNFILFIDVLSSLSSMNSLTPEQSANATPDASLQPSSINSAQRYLHYIEEVLSITDIKLYPLLYNLYVYCTAAVLGKRIENLRLFP